MKDKQIIEHILEYIRDIENHTEACKADVEVLKTNVLYKQGVSFCLMQIGELTAKLSEEFRQNTPDMPWKEIRSFRNILVHNYGNVDLDYVWSTIVEDLPALKKFCEKSLSQE